MAALSMSSYGRQPVRGRSPSRGANSTQPHQIAGLTGQHLVGCLHPAVDGIVTSTLPTSEMSPK